MGVLDRFEKRLGGMVEGSFARIFRSRVESVEISAALAREADINKAIGPQRVLVPNVYLVDLGSSDYAHLAPYAFTLGDELAAMQREHAAEQGYSFVGPVTVTLQEQTSLRTGAFRISSRVEAGSEAVPSARVYTPPPRPAAAPSPPPATPPPPVAPPAPSPPRTPPADDAGPTDAGQTVAFPPPRPPEPPKPLVHGHLHLPGGEQREITDRPLVVGRGEEADVRLADSSVSRRHARFTVIGGKVTVEDLGSTNGTTLNGSRIQHSSLADGDQVAFGGATVVFRS